MATNFIPGIADTTTANLHVYADGTSGNDANSGLSVGSPKRTIDAVFKLIPKVIKHKVAVHLKGTFTNWGYCQYVFWSENDFVIDGGSESVILDDRSGSNYVANVSSVNTIGDTVNAAWSVDQYAGYWVEILSGTCASQIRLIQGNTSNTITVCKNFTADPGAGATFRIIRPKTELNGTSFYGSNLILSIFGSGSTYIQRLYLSGTTSSITIMNSPSVVFMNNIVSDSTFVSNGSLSAQYTNNIQMACSGFNDPDTFIFNTVQQNNGVSLRSSSGRVYCGTVGLVSITGCYFANLQLSAVSDLAILGYGTRIKGKVLSLSGVYSSSTAAFMDSASAVTSIDSSTTHGISMIESKVGLNAISIKNNTNHGIMVDRSRVNFNAAVSGTGNAGAGVYAQSSSVILTKAGSPPTLTGTVGGGCELSTDGTTQKSTWAAIEAGTPVADAAEFVIAKKG
jgi:hypothetical protein